MLSQSAMDLKFYITDTWVNFIKVFRRNFWRKDQNDVQFPKVK